MSELNTNEIPPVRRPMLPMPSRVKLTGDKARSRMMECGKHLFIWLILAFSFFPMYMVVNISLKSNAQFFSNPWFPSLPFQWSNWAYGWRQIAPMVMNTIFICASAVGLTLILGTCAAYFFARYKMPGSRIFWALFLALMLMPAIANLIPLFSLLRTLNLLNTFMALIVVGASGGQVVTVYIMRNFIEDIPEAMFDAARIDGAGDLHQILYIVVPMSGSILATLAILRYIAEWNSFVLPLIVLRDEYKLPIAVKLYQMEGAYVKEWGPLMACYAIAAIPLVLIFLFSMRLFVKGLSAGAVKG